MVASNKRTVIGRQAPDETESTAGIKPGVSPGSHGTLISVGFRSHSRRQTARARCRRRARPREGSPAARTTMRRYWISGPRRGRPGQAAGSCLPSTLRATTARGDSAPTSFLTVLDHGAALNARRGRRQMLGTPASTRSRRRLLVSPGCPSSGPPWPRRTAMLAPGGQTQRCSCGSAGRVSEIFRLPTRTRTAVCGPALTGVRLGHPGQAHNTAICAAGIANAYRTSRHPYSAICSTRGLGASPTCSL